MRYLLIILLFSLFSCSTKRDILLIQDINYPKSVEIDYNEIILKPDDILKIQVYSTSKTISELFNTISSPLSSSSKDSYLLNGYRINEKGLIDIPIIGELLVSGLTVSETKILIENSLIKKQILKDPTVDVKILNSYFTILGEVKNPGRYNFIKNNLNLLQAIGMAGDLTINGERNSVKILRSNDKNIDIQNIDLTSSNFFETEYFQVLPDDIIIINPNSSRVKNAGIIGNAGNLLSILSFILSTIILITSNN